MEKSITKRKVISEFDLESFWDLFYLYNTERAELNKDTDEYDYFKTLEYKSLIESLKNRKINPLGIYLFFHEDELLGFIQYVIYHDEEGKCFVTDVYIKVQFRNNGYGKAMFEVFEKEIKSEQGLYMALTPSNENNKRFYKRIGFIKSDEIADNSLYYYKKKITN